MKKFWATTLNVRFLVSAVFLALALNLLVWGNFAIVASAHAHLKTATVAPNATINKAPSAITLTFGEESDLQQTRIQVLDSKKADVGSGPATVAPGDAKTWTVNLKAGLADGVYTVIYHTLTDDDGGIVDGSYTFTLSSSGTVAAGTTTGNDTGEKETGGSNAPSSAPATGEGGAAAGQNMADAGLLPFLTVLFAVILAASGLLLRFKRENKRS